MLNPCQNFVYKLFDRAEKQIGISCEIKQNTGNFFANNETLKFYFQRKSRFH